MGILCTIEAQAICWDLTGMEHKGRLSGLSAAPAYASLFTSDCLSNKRPSPCFLFQYPQRNFTPKNSLQSSI